MTTTLDRSVSAAYAYCIDLTGRRARNFSYGIRLLPGGQRAALSAVYALARRIDDIGDGDLAADDKLRRLADVRRSLHELERHADDPVLVAVADTARRHPVPLSAFDELVDGVELDVRGARVETFDDLVHYCRCVAGSVGRLCLGVFGTPDPATASPFADALGVALQQTNVLRDVREDLLAGRVYLPAQDLDRFGVDLHLAADGSVAGPPDALAALVAFAARRAATWYEDGLRLLPLLDRRSAACCAAMAGVYRRLLDRITARPTQVLTRRVSLPGWEKALVAGRALAGAGT